MFTDNSVSISISISIDTLLRRQVLLGHPITSLLLVRQHLSRCSNDQRNPRDPDHTNDYSVCDDLSARGIARKLEAQAAVDHAKRDDGPSEPDVGSAPPQVGHGVTLRGLLFEHEVVERSEDGLNGEDEAEDYDADDRVGVVELRGRVRHPYAEAEGGAEEEEPDDLEGVVDPDDVGDGAEAG